MSLSNTDSANGELPTAVGVTCTERFQGLYEEERRYSARLREIVVRLLKTRHVLQGPKKP
jgi:hypothetical protein